MSIIEVRNLCWEIGKREIFKDFSLSIKRGEKVILTSASGKGKSSFLKLLLGFLHSESGRIIVDDLEMNAKNVIEIRKKMAYVSQDVDLRNDLVKKVINDIKEFEKRLGVEWSNDQLINYLHEFNLDEDILEKQIVALSGGERQRLGLIICFMLNRKIWLLDEITSGLDLELKNLVQKKIIEGTETVILISHDKHWDFSRFREIKW